MENRQQTRREAPDDASINMRSIVATVAAMALGAIAGGIAASKLPSDKFIWTGFALVPLFALLEVCLKRIAALFGGTAHAVRFTLDGALVTGFHGACFAVGSQ